MARRPGSSGGIGSGRIVSRNRAAPERDPKTGRVVQPKKPSLEERAAAGSPTAKAQIERRNKTIAGEIKRIEAIDPRERTGEERRFLRIAKPGKLTTQISQGQPQTLALERQPPEVQKAIEEQIRRTALEKKSPFELSPAEALELAKLRGQRDTISVAERKRFEAASQTTSTPLQETRKDLQPTSKIPQEQVDKIISGEFDKEEAKQVTEFEEKSIITVFKESFKDEMKEKDERNLLAYRTATGSALSATLSDIQRRLRSSSKETIGRETKTTSEVKAGLAGAAASGIGLAQFGIELSTSPIKVAKTAVTGVKEGAKKFFVERKSFPEIGKLIKQETSYAFGFIAAEVAQDVAFAQLPKLTTRLSRKYRGVKTTAFGEEVITDLRLKTPQKKLVSTTFDPDIIKQNKVLYVVEQADTGDIGRLIRTKVDDSFGGLVVQEFDFKYGNIQDARLTSLKVKPTEKTFVGKYIDEITEAAPKTTKKIDLKLIPETGEVRRTQPLKAVKQTTIPLVETPTLPKLSKTQKKILKVVKERGDVISGGLAQKTLVKGERSIKDIDILSYNPLETAQQIKARLGKGAKIKQGTRSTKVIYKGKEVADVVPISIGEEGFINVFDKAIEVEGIQFLQPEARLASKVKQLEGLPAVRPSSQSFAQRQKVLEDIRLLTGGQIDTRSASFRGGFGFSQKEQAAFLGQEVTLASSASDFFRVRPSQLVSGDDLTVGQRIKRALGKETKILPGESKDVKGLFSTPTLAEEGSAQTRKAFVSGSVEANVVDLVTEPVEDLAKSLFQRRKKAQIIIQPDVEVGPKGLGGAEAFGRKGSSELEITQFTTPSGERGIIAKDKLIAKTIIERQAIPGKASASFTRKVPTDIIQAKFIDPSDLGDDLAKALSRAEGPEDLTLKQILQIEKKTKVPISAQFTSPTQITDVPEVSNKLARVVDDVSSESRKLEIKLSGKRPLRTLARSYGIDGSLSKSKKTISSISYSPKRLISLSKSVAPLQRVSKPSKSITKTSLPKLSLPKPSKKRGSKPKPSEPKSPPPSIPISPPISPPGRPPKSPPKYPPLSPPFSPPKIPTVKITPPPIPLPRGKPLKPLKISRILKVPKKSLYIPDFTARVFNIGVKAPKGTKRKKYLKKLLEEEFSGIEIRPGIILK